VVGFDSVINGYFRALHKKYYVDMMMKRKKDKVHLLVLKMLLKCALVFPPEPFHEY